jgi:nuclear protein NHN1
LPPHASAGFAGRAAPATEESAWERGLRTAKEMMRKANKRKELDIDFEEKKMNLSGPPDEIERDPYYHHGSPSDVIFFAFFTAKFTK